MTTLIEYSVDVKRKCIEDVDHWYATLADGTSFHAVSENELREQVRAHLLTDAAKKTKKSEGELTVRLRRTWNVRVVDGPAVETEEVVWDLFA